MNFCENALNNGVNAIVNVCGDIQNISLTPNKEPNRVVSSEISKNFPRKISGNFRKFIPIFPEISENFLNNFFTL